MAADPGNGAPSWADQSPAQALAGLLSHVRVKRHQSSAVLRRRADTRWPRNSTAAACLERPASPALHPMAAQNAETRKPPVPGDWRLPVSSATRPDRRRQRRPKCPPAPSSDARKNDQCSCSCRHCAASSAKRRCSAAMSPRGLRPWPSGTRAPRKACRS